jgi:hypothetical protein
MGMLDWFKGIMRGDSAPEAAPAAVGEDKGAELAGLNFKTAVDAHMKWKVRLESYIGGTSTEQLKVDLRQRRREVRLLRNLPRCKGPPCAFPPLRRIGAGCCPGG